MALQQTQLSNTGFALIVQECSEDRSLSLRSGRHELPALQILGGGRVGCVHHHIHECRGASYIRPYPSEARNNKHGKANGCTETSEEECHHASPGNRDTLLLANSQIIKNNFSPVLFITPLVESSPVVGLRLAQAVQSLQTSTRHVQATHYKRLQARLPLGFSAHTADGFELATKTGHASPHSSNSLLAPPPAQSVTQHTSLLVC